MQRTLEPTVPNNDYSTLRDIGIATRVLEIWFALGVDVHRVVLFFGNPTNQICSKGFLATIFEIVCQLAAGYKPISDV